jgi:hypothetical protein
MAKYIEVTTLDRPRRMSFRYADLKELSRMLGGAPLFGDGGNTDTSMLTRLSRMDPFALSAFTWVGLRNHDRDLLNHPERADDIIQEFLDAGKRPADLVSLVLDGLRESGIIRTEKAEQNGHPTEA